MTFVPEPLLALAAPPQGGQQPNFLMSFLPILLIVGVFYFLVFMPARKRQKKHQAMLDGLKSGDRVVTSGGIFGTVVAVDDAKVQLRVADQVKIEVAKSAVSGLVERTS